MVMPIWRPVSLAPPIFSRSFIQPLDRTPRGVSKELSSWQNLPNLQPPKTTVSTARSTTLASRDASAPGIAPTTRNWPILTRARATTRPGKRATRPTSAPCPRLLAATTSATSSPASPRHPSWMSSCDRTSRSSSTPLRSPPAPPGANQTRPNPPPPEPPLAPYTFRGYPK
jgi:hypothetical protein